MAKKTPKKPAKKPAKKALKVVKFSEVKKKAGGGSVARELDFSGAAPAPAAAVNTVVLNNVRPEELDTLLAELRADPRVISTQVIPEGDGEFTVIVQHQT